MALKGFRVSEDTLKIYEDLKQKERINSDLDFFIRMLDYTKKGQEERERDCVPVELFEAKDREIKALYIKLGELQGELNVYKQKALPKKPFWKRLFGGRDS